MKMKKRPSSHNCFTAEMDLAAAGLLGQVPQPPAQIETAPDQQPQGQLRRSKEITLLHDRQQAAARLQHRWQLAGQHQHSMAEDGSAVEAEMMSPGAKEMLIQAGLLSEDQVSRT